MKPEGEITVGKLLIRGHSCMWQHTSDESGVVIYTTATSGDAELGKRYLCQLCNALWKACRLCLMSMVLRSVLILFLTEVTSIEIRGGEGGWGDVLCPECELYFVQAELRIILKCLFADDHLFTPRRCVKKNEWRNESISEWFVVLGQRHINKVESVAWGWTARCNINIKS